MTRSKHFRSCPFLIFFCGLLCLAISVNSSFLRFLCRALPKWRARRYLCRTCSRRRPRRKCRLTSWTATRTPKTTAHPPPLLPTEDRENPQNGKIVEIYRVKLTRVTSRTTGREVLAFPTGSLSSTTGCEGSILTIDTGKGKLSGNRAFALRSCSSRVKNYPFQYHNFLT